MNFTIDTIVFDEKGLVPAIIQDIYSGKVLMLAFMNKESLQKTLETNMTWFFSRKRKQLWNKGETSGNKQLVKKISYDCDADTLLVEVEQIGVTCHTGEASCFHNEIRTTEEVGAFNREIVNDLYDFIQYRKENPVEGSYTNYLFTQGIDKILKKIGEESSEVIIGAKNPGKDELIYELSDLIYHSIVLMINKGVTIDELKGELTKRMMAKQAK
ncbi:bifunctional phosphoribosyl-AMP cyclohydrolase/phosphoribosyl-ATP diphosphatase HisIE [Caldibacillus lycopersici]|uniref:Histidine biosynthesis bifunctional protein HisIE n=1 Tax=Perspicuibacillus lycopersici TaxID=1325689 RepID=A0AAE3IUE7_9BACI|nr:bifunctional phosphoribosyl-AMP cyclohydrolase/phosphoribosyl-ATP diphosphatase HisIE [Perspicuibacillus lycopersici]MCU9613788.1 bifunctional phosphoribosyl-AMP cyclohydrolase/phosphoribosyl-ATP diphosphatase HisIE [Perspicuibacillus lycopersici]